MSPVDEQEEAAETPANVEAQLMGLESGYAGRGFLQDSVDPLGINDAAYM